jgi:ubiquinol-cytochrome c reductase iron-sulfur subunit
MTFGDWLGNQRRQPKPVKHRGDRLRTETSRGGAGCEDDKVATTHASASAEPTRRDFLFLATGAAGAVGLAATIWPFISQMAPDAATIAAGAPVDFDLGPVAEGQIVKLFWRGKLIFVRHRTAAEIKAAQDTDITTLRDPEADSARVKAGKDQWLIVYGNCTHLGCVPLGNEGAFHGWQCPCHGSVFDTSGRIRQGPAPINLPVPPYAFTSDKAIRIG